MFRKIVSTVLTASLLFMLTPISAFAADEEIDFISALTVTVPGSLISTFTPAKGHTLNVAVTTDPINNPSGITEGYVQITKGGKVVKKLSNWAIGATLSNLSALTWNGKDIEATTEAQSICTPAGSYCPAGDYLVEVYMKTATVVTNVPGAGDTGVQFDTASFKFTLVTPPTVEVTDLAVSKAIYNPLLDTAGQVITFKTSAPGYITTEILAGTTPVATLLDKQFKTGGTQTVTWNGKDKDGNLLINNKYNVRVVSREAADGGEIDKKTLEFIYEIPQTIVINKFELVPTKGGTTFDPAPSAGNEDLTLSYELNKQVNEIKIEIKDSKNTSVKVFTDSNDNSDSFLWDGKFGLDYALPGTYTATLTATLPGEAPKTLSKTIVIAYTSASVVSLDALSVAPSSFDPNYDDAVLSFINSNTAKLTVEVQNAAGSLIADFANYKGDSYNAGTSHNISWNGKNTSDVYATTGTYNFVITARNDYGVTVGTKAVTLSSAGGSMSDNNAHIKNISLKPSSKFEPGIDDEIVIKFDILSDLESLIGTATRGSQKFEFMNEVDPAKESNYEVVWDGTDDDGEYVEEGTWKILLRSKKDGKELLAAKTINIGYNKPSIDTMLVSKDKFDHEAGEFTQVLFKLKDDANVTLEVLDNGSVDDTITEDMEVEKNIWYAVEWDGGNYDYADKISLKLTASNKFNDKVYTFKIISVDLAEDTVSSNKANIKNDYIAPVITDGSDEMMLYFDMDDTADVTITIHKGASTSGTKVADLLDVKDLSSGSHALKWNGLDKDNRKLPKGEYTYKIVSKLKSTETETGTFIVGEVGSSSSTTTKTTGSKSNIASNVTFLTGEEPTVEEPKVEEPKVEEPKVEVSNCGSFTDITAKSPYCEAAAWTKDAKIFQGYFDGSFKPYQAINRAEALKVVLEGLGLSGVPTQENLGFSDVQVNSWYMPYINNAKKLGVFHGDAGKATARPEGTVNRVEALKFIFETLRITAGINSSYCQNSYGDVDSNSWYVPYACASMQYQLFDGLMLNPAQPSTRGEVAEVLFRLHKAGVI